MSYKVVPPRRIQRRAQPAPYPLYPLSSAHSIPPGVQLLPLSSVSAPKRDIGRKILLAIVIVMALLGFLYWLDQQLNDR